MLIDCDGCAVRDVSCADCVVSVLLNNNSKGDGGRREVDDAARQALEVLADNGLVPRLRLVPLGPPGRRPRSAAS